MDEATSNQIQEPSELEELMAKSQSGDIESMNVLVDLQKNPKNIQFFCNALLNWDLEKNSGFFCIRSLIKLVNPINENILEIQNSIKETIFKKADLFCSSPTFKNAITDLFIQAFQNNERDALNTIEELLSGQGFFLILGLQFAAEYLSKIGNTEKINVIFIKCIGPLLNLQSNLIEIQLSAEFYSSFIKSFENKELPKILVTQTLVIGSDRLFHHALTLPDPIATRYLDALDTIVCAPPKLFDSREIYINFLQSFMYNYVETIKSPKFSFTQIRPMLDISISFLNLPIIQTECNDTDLIISILEAISGLHEYTATKNELIRTPIEEEKCLKAFSIFFKLDAVTRSSEALEHAKSIIESAIDLFLLSIFDNDTVQASLLSVLFSYDPGYGIFEGLANLMGYNRELNTEKLINSFEDLTSNGNIAIAAAIEIAGLMIVSARNIDFDVPLFEAVATLCREMDQIDTQTAFDESNSPRLWTELAFVHFFEAIVKAYANSPKGDPIFVERIADVAIFYERILFMLQLDTVQTAEIHAMCRSAAIASLPPDSLAVFAASENIMESITQHVFPFILDEKYLEDAKELYHSFFEIGRIAGDDAVVKILETLGSCIDSSPEKDRISIHILDVAMESVIAGPVAFEYMRDTLVPSLASATNVDQHLKISEFLEKLSFTIYYREPFDKMSDAALSTLGAIMDAVASITEQLHFDSEETRDSEVKTLAKLVGTASGVLGWESINMGVLCVYGDEKIVPQFFMLFEAIAGVPMNCLLQHNSFRQGYVSIVGSFIEFLVENEFLHSETFIAPLINFTKEVFRDPALSEKEISTLSEAILKLAPPEAIADRDLVFGVVIAAQVAAPAPLHELAFAVLQADVVDWSHVIETEVTIGEERAAFVSNVIDYIHTEGVWMSSAAWKSISSMFDIVRGPIRAILMREE